MKLRDRLVLFSTVQLMLFGVLFAIAHWQFTANILPAMRHALEEKTVGIVHAIGSEIDVALATEDAELARATVQPYLNEPEFAHVAIRTADGRDLFARGTAKRDAFAGPPSIAHHHEDTVETWVPVTLEGVKLGAVSLSYSTRHLDALAAWARRGGIAVGLLWLLALSYSVWFARSFVSPIHAMVQFARKVASGTLAERIEINASAELRMLQEDLNSMASDLEHREAERKRRAEEAKEMQDALLVMSRTAGMAEVATNVLHNVGNVLNSLNVSVSVIGEQLRSSKVKSLARSIDAVGGATGFTDFLATEKGKLLPQYLATVTARLTEENTQVLAELASVASNVEHIKTIIATQQSYAHTSDMTEVVQIATVIDDALRMGEVSFSRHGIDVVKDFEPGLTIETDRHRLLEILINVVSNARHALKDAPTSSKRVLAIHLRRVDRGVTITISDTGVGIPAANLGLVFQHGFTTKLNGHGFGLHACANATQELGGSITATSAGAGLGAEFTITLPLQSPKRRSHDHHA
jgi:signal transduction histidine kinase